MFGHFVSYMLMLGHASTQASRRFLGLQLFHVKHNQEYQAKTYSYVFIWYSQSVGLRCNRSPNVI